MGSLSKISISRRGLSILGICLFIIFSALGISAGWLDQHHEESFDSKLYCDETNTTAFWDTENGLLTLYEGCILSGSYDTPHQAHDIAISGNNAYIADQSGGLVVLDISDPEHPLLDDSDNTGVSDAHGVAVAGDYAYIADYSYGLKVYDISDPTAIVPIGEAPAGTYSECITISGDYAFVGVHSHGIEIYDISNPSSPSSVGTYLVGNYVERIVIHGGYAYVATNRGSYDLLIIDVSDPSNPTYVGHGLTPHYPHGINVAGDYAFIADGETGMVVFNTTDPSNPSPVDTLATPGYAYDIQVSGNRAYIADWEAGGLTVVDITDPENTVLLGSYDTPGSAFDVYVSECYAFIGDYASGVQIFNICDRINPEFTGSYDTSGQAHDVVIYGDLGFVADWDGGLKIFDLSDLSNVNILSYYTASHVEEVFVSGDYAYLAEEDYLSVLDVSDPASPTLKSAINTPGYAYGVFVEDGLAFVADYEDGLTIVDVSDPSSLSIIGTCDTPDLAQAVIVQGNYAYVADGESGLQVIDVTSPFSPIIVGNYNTSHHAYDVEVDGNYAYVADSESGLQILDITDPTNVIFSGSYDTPDWARSVNVALDHAFVADRASGLLVFDISDPTNPLLTGNYNTPGEAINLAIDGFYACVADLSEGLAVIKVFDTVADTVSNLAQSLKINSNDDDIYSVRLTANQKDSIRWQVTVDGGSVWNDIPNGEGFINITPAGTDLRWKAVLTSLTGSEVPTCYNLEIDWLNETAIIDSIVDIRADEGGWVKVCMTRSGLDNELLDEIDGYNLYRKVEEQTLGTAIVNEGTKINDFLYSNVDREREKTVPFLSGIDVRAYEGRYFVSSPNFPEGEWEIVNSFYAMQLDNYECIVPTKTDSTENNIPYETYLVTAHASNSSAYYVSTPDSGYSVDNLPPALPTGLEMAEGTILNWEDNTESDLAGYYIYAKESYEGPVGKTYVSYISEFDIHDSNVNDGYHYWGVAAFDRHGNTIPPEDYTGLFIPSGGDKETPIVNKLEQNYPNPFNPTTTIKFSIMESGPVSLKIFDPKGRLVKNLVEGKLDAGNYIYTWSGVNKFGQNVSSGLYFYRIDAGDFSQTCKMLLLR